MGLYNFVTDVTRYFGPEHYVVDLTQIRSVIEPSQRTPCRVSQRLFDALDDYTRSMPTSPSSGRVYKKNYGWLPDVPDDWWVFFVRNGWWSENGKREYCQLHHPFRLVVDESLG